MKDYVVIVYDSDEAIYEDVIVVNNVNSLYADGFKVDYHNFTNIVINEKIVLKLPCKFIEYMELEEYKEKYKEEKND